MINLLPPNYKKELRSARVNVVLRRYIIFQVAAVGLLAAMIAATYLLISMTKTNAEQQIASNTERASGYAEVDQKAKQFQSNLSTAKTILDNEVRYTAVITAISNKIPKGVVLDVLNLDAKTFGEPTSLSAKAKTYDDALQLKESFEKSGIFSNVRLESVAKTDNATGDYPVDVRINVTIRKDIAQQ